MSREITVINRTASSFVYFIGTNQNGAYNFSDGFVVSGYLRSGESETSPIGEGNFMVGASPSGAGVPNQGSPCLMTYNVFPGTMVTYATEMGTRPDAEDSSTGQGA